MTDKKYTKEDIERMEDKTDYERLKNRSDEEVEKNAQEDLDSLSFTDEQMRKFKKVKK